MRIRWRGLELPNQVIRDEQSATDYYSKFIVEPFERGFGTTIGNSLRRVLLSSLEGAAVTRVQIKGAPHEFTSLPGVLEDVTDIVLNVKGLAVRLDGEGPRSMKVTRKHKGEVKARDIIADPSIEIINKDHHLATLTAEMEFALEMEVEKGRGWRAAEENLGPESDVNVFPVDSSFSPVMRVRYRAEDTRVGQRTNYDRLILEVWTNGVIKPEEALVEAAKILRKHLSPFVFYHELGSDQIAESVSPAHVEETELDDDLRSKLQMSVAELELSVRANNCLESARILTVGELVRCTESELLRVRSFGRTSLREVKRKLVEMGLSLGMNFGDNPPGHSGSAAAATASPSIAQSILPPVPSAKTEHPASSRPMMNTDSFRGG